MKWKKLIAGVCTGALLITALSGCSAKSNDKGNTDEGSKNTVTQGADDQTSAELPDVEFWSTNTGFLPVEKDSELYNIVILRHLTSRSNCWKDRRHRKESGQCLSLSVISRMSRNM